MNVQDKVTAAPEVRLKSNGLGLTELESQPDMVRMRTYRFDRIKAQLQARDVAGILLFDPINIRYAVGTRNMANWTAHNLIRYLFIATNGPTVMFDYHQTDHLSGHCEAIDELRNTRPCEFFSGGELLDHHQNAWADEMADLVCAHGGGNMRLAIDIAPPLGVQKLVQRGIEICDGKAVTELAREVKSLDEIAVMMNAVAVCEKGMYQMRQQLEPGMTENELWSILHQVNIAHGGEWIETRLLASGTRTNPWFQECADRMIRPNEIVSYDTDLIGPGGMCIDVSRSYFSGPGRPSDEHRRIYQAAWDQVHFNIDLLKPGMSFREFADKAWKIPDASWPLRYSCVAHGVGMADEYPTIRHGRDWNEYTYDGTFNPGMVICIESYMGEVGGSFGVKLEEQVLITEDGVQNMSTFPFEEELLHRMV